MEDPRPARAEGTREGSKASSPRAVVVGATGFTGGLVTDVLSKGSLPFLLTARDPEKLGRLAERIGGAATAVVDVTEPEALGRLLRPGDAVINCAGPFSRLGEPVIDACLEAGAHYLDTTGEQAFMKRVEERFGARAAARGVAVVNAMAFEYALGDCASALAAAALAGPPRRIDVTYAWRAGASSTSRGTRESILEVIASRGWAYREGSWRREPVAREARRVRLPDGRRHAAVSFPAGEVVTVPRHVDVETVRGWIVMGRIPGTLARVSSPLLPAVVSLLKPLLRPLFRRGPEGPTDEERRSGGFTILAEATDAGGGVRSVTVGGRDPYGLTAEIVVRGARRALRPEDGREGGVLAPAQLVEPRGFLEGLGELGVEVARG